MVSGLHFLEFSVEYLNKIYFVIQAKDLEFVVFYFIENAGFVKFKKLAYG